MSRRDQQLISADSLQGTTGMPKIARIELTSLEYVLEAGKGYGNARGVNNRRNCSLITLTTDDGVIGVGDAAGPARRHPRIHQAARRRSSPAAASTISTSSSTQIRNRLYHFGVQGHFIAALGGINIAIHDAIGKTLGVPVHDLLGGRNSRPARLLRHHRLFHRRSEGRHRGATVGADAKARSSASRSRSAPASPRTSSACAMRARRSATTCC